MIKVILGCLVAPLVVVLLIFWASIRPKPNGRDVDQIVFVAETLKAKLIQKNISRDFIWEIQPRRGGGVISIKSALSLQEIEVINSEFRKIEPKNGVEIKFAPIEKAK